MSKPGARYVACSDKAELDSVRENVLKKKLNVERGDLDGALERVWKRRRIAPNPA